MTTKIAVCDDVADLRTQICSFLTQVAHEEGYEFDIVCYESAEDLLEHFDDDIQILLLDIMMSGATGMEAARRLRDNHKSLCIIFISVMVQYALEGYDVHAFGFLKKPLEYTAFKRQIREALASLQSERKRLVSLRSGTSIDVIDASQIVYIEVKGRNLTVATQRGQFSYAIPLKEVEPVLGDDFFKCHKSYIVNFAHVRTVEASDIVMDDGSVVPLSKHRRKDCLIELSSFVRSRNALA